MIYKKEILVKFNICNLSVLGLLILSIAGCSSTPAGPTTDVCTVVKHWRDNVFQVKINDEAISKHFYIHADAVEVTKKLADQNKCMP